MSHIVHRVAGYPKYNVNIISSIPVHVVHFKPTFDLWY